MNIVVIGSCADSSYLAKELNKRLNNSIVARIDLLKNIKQLILQDMNVSTNENIGTYIGDIEAYDLSKAADAQKVRISAALKTVNTGISLLKKEQSNFIGRHHMASTFDALTNSLPIGTYSFIKVYSGAIDEDHISNMVCDTTFLTSSIFVVIKKPHNLLLPITVSPRTLDKVKKDAFAFIECDEAADIFKSEVFQLLFELNNEKKQEVKPLTKPAEVSDEVGIDLIEAGAVQMAA